MTAADDDEDGALPSGTKNYITTGGYARLLAERNDLMRKERPDVVKVVSWAASNGDRSENADYQYGKKRLREIDRRIRFLNKRIESAEVVDPLQQQDLGRVYFGATVTFVGADDLEETWRIVGIDEADPGAGKLSWIAPLARALFRAAEGDVVRFQSPGGLRELEIVEIRYQTVD